MTVETKSESAALYERAKRVLPGGVSRNTVLRSPHPHYAASAAGCRVTDIEGVERIDFANNMASLIHGHSHPAIVAAVTEQLGKGTAYTLATEVEVAFAEHLLSRNDDFDKLRFVNSGTEATMAAVKAARAFTGRAKIAKVEGAYHGQYDYAEVSQTANPSNWGSAEHPASVPVASGTPAAVLADVVVIPFDDPEHAVAILDEHRGEIAAVLFDVMPHRVGLVPASFEFVSAMREWTRADGALLVIDEVITFRSAYGGAHTAYDLKPDLVAMGKMIGGGFPVGAIAGRGEVMEVMNPLADNVLFPHSGTFSANPVTMTAGLTAMELFDRDEVERVNGLARRAMDGIEAAIAATGVTACVTGGGSMFRVHLKDRPPHNYRETYPTPEQAGQLTLLLDHLLDEGFMMINTLSATVSTPMGEGEIDALVAAMDRGFRKLGSG
ncbi:MAG: aminotransferase class III-fold pyridoxal phosphate-dependent enzyme [Acidimicrobiia bacterium]|nr:aminotransferase class III-fold pyridoxal phosphate-dependent enzyme [Acidimicrobiia bacterium]NNL71519.1 aminotransferase class III-fold pyridoxal phosphate-dependent enzyme [Acidimicrobiia bacterium]RZV42211.1 MAG: aminotransferase class III-fold pyridoxal phosphate-dependent enzyme [Acidimicrobiia bacterium]